MTKTFMDQYNNIEKKLKANLKIEAIKHAIMVNINNNKDQGLSINEVYEIPISDNSPNDEFGLNSVSNNDFDKALNEMVSEEKIENQDGRFKLK